ncbi:hypothetical protein AGR3A_Lc130054 [Agrobacterium tomkonis CFBP 6623]|uniref:Uncharacterized protein n=1 Tax=Agrobacterium tomkonis CFBP 6623 TaxID=1183432 RepID=A0A1S7R6F3_9HYPH|nr:hypothetical protein AGR3A_Lc130054 [Agrobacterium tomkonis CFBP 6623]
MDLSGCSSGVEHNLAKVGVEGSNPFARSKFSEKRNIHGILNFRPANYAGLCGLPLKSSSPSPLEQA